MDKKLAQQKRGVTSCPPNIKHFHGVTDTSNGSHIAITQEQDGKNVEWLELVSDKEYKDALKEARE